MTSDISIQPVIKKDQREDAKKDVKILIKNWCGLEFFTEKWKKTKNEIPVLIDMENYCRTVQQFCCSLSTSSSQI